ncbi:hypothetical protein AMTRI_Chr12g271660 [Amborella trichopoda]
MRVLSDSRLENSPIGTFLPHHSDIKGINLWLLSNGKYLISFTNKFKPVIPPNPTLSFKGGILSLLKWNPSMGAQQISKFWITLERIPFHLWSNKVVQILGNSCGQFLSVHWKSMGFLPLGQIVILISIESVDQIPSSLSLHFNGLSYKISVSTTKLRLWSNENLVEPPVLWGPHLLLPSPLGTTIAICTETKLRDLGLPKLLTPWTIITVYATS